MKLNAAAAGATALAGAGGAMGATEVADVIWTMLNAICLMIGPLAAVGAARDAKTGFVGYTLAVVIGVALGGCAAWVMWTAGERVDSAIEARAEATRERYFALLYMAAVLWIIFVVFVADHVTSAAMQLGT